MIKILHLITGLNTGGAEIMLYKLLSEMDKNKFNNCVVCLTDLGTIGPRIKSLGINVYTLNMKKNFQSFSKVLELIKILQKERPELLQTWLYHADLLGLCCGKMAGLKHIVWNLRCSDMNMFNYSRISVLLIKVLARLSPLPDLVITNSSSGRIEHEKIGYRPKKWEIIYNGFEIDKFSPITSEEKMRIRLTLGIDKNIFLIGHVARFDPMKDHLNFLKAANIFVSKYQQKDKLVRFIMIGRNVDGNNNFFVNNINNLGLKEYVCLLGERGDISELMPGMDLVVSSSAYGEGFPNILGEAMACGVPCVTTDVGDSAIVVGETGLVVASENPEELATAWDKLYRMSDEQIKKLGVLARERIEDNFSINVIKQKYEKIYIDLVCN